MFQCLTEKGRDNREVRRPTSVRTLAELTGVEPAAMLAVINAFHQQGRSFLTTTTHGEMGPDSVIDISHESLIRLWGRLRAWVEQESQSARMYRRLAEASEDYAAGQGSPWKGPELQNALLWKEREKPTALWARRYGHDFDATMAFLETSKRVSADEAAEKERRAREELDRAKRHARMAWGLSSLIVLLGFAATIGGFQYVRAARQIRMTNDRLRNEIHEKDELARRELLLKQEKERMLGVVEKQKSDLDTNNAELQREKLQLQQEFSNEKKANQEKDVAIGNYHSEADRRQVQLNELVSYIKDELFAFDSLTSDTKNRDDLQQMYESNTDRVFDLTSKRLKEDPDNHDLLTANWISRTLRAELLRKRRTEKEALAAINENIQEADRLSSSQDGFQVLGAAILYSTVAVNLNLLKRPDEALKRATQAETTVDRAIKISKPVVNDEFAMFWRFVSFVYNATSGVYSDNKKYQQAFDLARKAAQYRLQAIDVQIHLNELPNNTVDSLVDYLSQAESSARGLHQIPEGIAVYNSALEQLHSSTKSPASHAAYTMTELKIRLNAGAVCKEDKNFTCMDQHFSAAYELANEIQSDKNLSFDDKLQALRDVGIAWREAAPSETDATRRKHDYENAVKVHLQCLKEDTEAATKDKSWGRWHSLTVSNYSLGEDCYEAGDYRQGEKYWSDRLLVAQEAAGTEVAKTHMEEALRTLADCYHDVCRVEERLFNFDAARQNVQGQIQTLEKLTNHEKPDPKDVAALADAFGTKAWVEIQSGNFAQALEDANRGLNLAPQETWISVNKAHAILFLGHFDEAERTYRECGDPASKQGRNLQKSILDDFQEFEDKRYPKIDLMVVQEMKKRLIAAGFSQESGGS